MKLEITTGRGLTFDGNKLTSDAVESDLFVKKSDGIYVPSLVGKDGGNGGSIVDGITIKGGTETIDGINYNNIMNIFCISAFKISSHKPSNDNDITLPLIGNSETSHVKQISDIVSELNFDSENGICYQVPYQALTNDLIMLKNTARKGASCKSPNKSGQFVESGIRYQDSVPYALFTIDDILYSTTVNNGIRDWTCRKLIITCVWVTNADTLAGDAVRSVYEPGQVYQYN